DRRHEALPLQPIAIQIAGLEVRRRGERHAASEERREEIAENHRVGDVVDRELVEADDPRAIGEMIRDDLERVLAVAQLLQAVVHLGHEAVEMQPQLVFERQRRVEEIHHQRLAAADAAPEIQAAHGLDRALQTPRDAPAPASRRRAGREEIAIEPFERGDGFGLRTVRHELSRRDAASVLCKRAHQTESSGRLRNSSSDSGFSSASRFPIATPWIASRTAISEILPLRVRGISLTSRILAGTCRGLASRRSRVRISSMVRSSSRWPGCMRTKSTTRVSPSKRWSTATHSAI